MSILTNIETTIQADFKTTWNDVLSLVAKLKQALPVIEQDLQVANTWIVNNAATLIADATEILSILAGFNITLSPALITGIQTAAAALNTFATSEQAQGGPSLQAAVIAGAAAYAQLGAAHAAASVAIAQAPTATAAAS